MKRVDEGVSDLIESSDEPAWRPWQSRLGGVWAAMLSMGLLAACGTPSTGSSAPGSERLVANATIRQVVYVEAAEIAAPAASAASGASAGSASASASAPTAAATARPGAKPLARAPKPPVLTASQRRAAAAATANAASAARLAKEQQADRQRELTVLQAAPGFSYVYYVQLDAGQTKVMRFPRDQAANVNDRVLVEGDKFVIVR